MYSFEDEVGFYKYHLTKGRKISFFFQDSISVLILFICLLRFLFVISFRSVVKVTPSILKFCGSHSKLNSGSIVSSWGLGHPNQIAFVFPWFIFRPEYLANSYKAFRQCLRERSEPSMKRLVSSAY